MTASPPPAHLPLHAWHVAHGARMESFAGWSMPIHYPLGILGEHRHTRAAAGLFDVSHMGQIVVRAHSGDHLAAARALETLVPIDVLGLKPGRQRYALFTDEAGGVLDDLMIANLGDCWHLVVNAAAAAADLAHLRDHLRATCSVEPGADRALLALQGPDACAALAPLVPAVAQMRFMDAGVLEIEGAACFISRSGYTGEDGFEVSVPAARALDLAERLLRHPSVQLIGLGARDSLRLEAGLCLCGDDLGAQTTPVEAALDWAIPAVRRRGGARQGGFPGADIILDQLENGTSRKRVGLRSKGRPVREGASLFADADAEAVIGRVTSGTYGPSADGPVAMAYVPMSLTPTGTRLFAEVRGERIPLDVSAMPFVPHRYHR